MLGVMNLSFISSSDIFRKSPILPIIQNYAAKIIIIPQFPKPPSPPQFSSLPSPPNSPAFLALPILQPSQTSQPSQLSQSSQPSKASHSSHLLILKKKPTYSPTLYVRYTYPLGRANNKRKMSKV